MSERRRYIDTLDVRFIVPFVSSLALDVRFIVPFVCSLALDVKFIVPFVCSLTLDVRFIVPFLCSLALSFLDPQLPSCILWWQFVKSIASFL